MSGRDLKSFSALNISASDKPKSNWVTRPSRACTQTLEPWLQQCDSKSHQNFSEIPTHQNKWCWMCVTWCEHILSESRSLEVKTREAKNQRIFRVSAADFLETVQFCTGMTTLRPNSNSYIWSSTRGLWNIPSTGCVAQGYELHGPRKLAGPDLLISTRFVLSLQAPWPVWEYSSIKNIWWGKETRALALAV